jgi:spermidine synthase
MVDETLKLCADKAKANQSFRVLMFGLGGGAVPMHIRHRCESALIESVESDARVALIAQRLFGFRADSKNKVEIADGEEAAQRHAATHPWPAGPHYDVVLVDCFDGDNHVSHSCRSERFLHAIRTSLGPDGHVFHNVIDSDIKRVLPMYQATFGKPWTWQKTAQNGQTIIVAKTHSNHPRHA